MTDEGLADPDLEAWVLQNNGGATRFDVQKARAVAHERPLARTRAPMDGQVTDTQLAGVDGEMAVRVYHPGSSAGHLIVYLHGGMWMLGDLETHDRTCRRLAAATGARVMAVELRLAPEHPWPAAVDDAETAVTWACDALGAGALASVITRALSSTIVTITLAQLVQRLTVRAFAKNSERAAVRLAGCFLAYVVVAAGLVYMLEALHVQIGPLIGALGITGIALAFALQDILQNLVAGVILQARRPVRRGDQVQVGSYQGIVRDIDLRTVLIRTFDGLDVYLPNKTVLENPIVNYTISPTRRLTLPVGVGHGSDLETVQRCLVDAVCKVPGVLADPRPAAWVTGFGASSIDFSVLAWFTVSGNSLRQIQSDVAIAVKAALDAESIEIPFPQRTLSLGPGMTQVLSSHQGLINGAGHTEPEAVNGM